METRKPGGEGTMPAGSANTPQNVVAISSGSSVSSRAAAAASAAGLNQRRRRKPSDGGEKHAQWGHPAGHPGVQRAAMLMSSRRE